MLQFETMPFFTDPLYQLIAAQALLLIFTAILCFVLHKHLRITLSPKALFVGSSLFLILPLLVSLSHEVVIKAIVVAELLGNIDPKGWISRNLYRNVPPVLSVCCIFAAGYVAAGHAPHRKFLHGVLVSLFYPALVFLSCFLINASGLIRVEHSILLGGPTLLFLFLVIPVCGLGASFDPSIGLARGAFVVQLFLAFSLVVSSVLLDQTLRSIPPQIDKVEASKIENPSHLALTLYPYAQPEGPKRCFGFHDFGLYSIWGKTLSCPNNSAIFGAQNEQNSRYAPASDISLSIDCCPLPSDDILSSEHTTSTTECPEGFVVTGGASERCNKRHCQGSSKPSASRSRVTYCSSCQRELRCTKINSKRYRLGPKTRGVRWAITPSNWTERFTILKWDIPLGIRRGLGVRTPLGRANRSCVGFPFGSLLVAKWGANCHDLAFRQLLFRGAPGDPPEGTPVKMFPDCYQAEPYSMRPTCE